MLTASNRLWMEKAANKWFTYTDRKMILKLKNLLGIWFGLMFIEWNIIITFLLYSLLVQHYRIEPRIKAIRALFWLLCLFSQCAHPSLHHLEIYPSTISLFIGPSVHSSSIYFRKLRVVDFILPAHQLRHWQSFTQTL